MKTNSKKAIVSLIVIILIALIPLGAAAPSGISESTVVEAARSCKELNPFTEAMIYRALIVLT